MDSGGGYIDTDPGPPKTDCKSIESVRVPFLLNTVRCEVEASHEHSECQRELGVGQTVYCQYFARTPMISTWNLLDS